MSATPHHRAITGSSGAGTTSVTRTFENIFRRENVDAAIIEGDSFHRYDRADALRWPKGGKPGQPAIQPLRPGGQPLRRTEALFATTPRRHRQDAANLHDAARPRPTSQEPGTFTPWEDLRRAAT